MLTTERHSVNLGDWAAVAAIVTVVVMGLQWWLSELQARRRVQPGGLLIEVLPWGTKVKPDEYGFKVRAWWVGEGLTWGIGIFAQNDCEIWEYASATHLREHDEPLEATFFPIGDNPAVLVLYFPSGLSRVGEARLVKIHGYGDRLNYQVDVEWWPQTWWQRFKRRKQLARVDRY